MRDRPSRRQAARRATQAFAETTNGGSGSLSLQSSRNAVRRSGSRPATCAPDGATPSVNGSHQSSNVACSTSTATALSTNPSFDALHVQGLAHTHVAKEDHFRWSLYGAPWLQSVATGRKSR